MYDSYILLKFIAKFDFLLGFLDGKLYFNTTDYFSNIENDGQGDYLEGSTISINYNRRNGQCMKLCNINGESCIVTCNENNMVGTPICQYSSYENRHRKIISFYKMYTSIENNCIFPISPKIEETFGEYGVIILDSNELINRIENKIKSYSNIQSFQIGDVKYVNEKKDFIIGDVFKKRKEFEYQNEFRMTFIDNTEKPFILDLGCDLKDIVSPFLSKDLDSFRLENGKIIYPKYEISNT